MEVKPTTIYKIADIAALFSVSNSTIYKWIQKGRFPSGQVGPGGQFWTQRTIDEFFKFGQMSKVAVRQCAKKYFQQA